MQRHPMTKEGADALQQELQKLKTVERPKVSKAIAEAREHGDLKENAEYHAAREEQGLIEARIKLIEGLLGSVQIIDVTKLKPNGKVVFGSTVTVLNLETDEEVTYKIVGEEEADIKHNKISVNSPIARALIAKEEGDEVVVKAPKGNIDYEIVEIQYI
ncbi:MAG: transcription elongation factor GreA [Piscirickettsiaceae bacterium CG_4_9_14_3_um_filter_43_564]|nr:transcription elongation factor GreA [Thiomicrospira sp.]OIP96818.1 MAG: transcription elongation factor GreA [Thiomicrospira sp. CG2_30_44_34]PIQ04714.1 MAG: transcription elongation factor GreA [Piscirickettsiaceae bacterium CG18_big_fil_WC_8_21_14_2_50_44_103]PIU39348.1 MAG: transcription elongation factor GreA [Piscirickettsiaceae bacterium CG07_land_8_20_14_0_80_44_28]PIW56732.1 MAG: transcription elongation factor GreA [Piscirickettsiaceae bacterium CG12_big_fil_rev_8_21_14_0_65_44_934